MKLRYLAIVVIAVWSNFAWARTFTKHFQNSTAMNSVFALTDGSTLVAGTGGPEDSPQPVLIRLSASGQIIWCSQYSLGPGYYGSFQKIIQAENSTTFYIIGERAKVSNDEADPLLVKVNLQGRIIWKRTIIGGFSDYFYDIVRTTDGVAVAGETGTFARDQTAAWIVAFSKTGRVRFATAFDRGFQDIFRGIIATRDGGFLLSGTTDISAITSDGFKGFLVKASADGIHQWHRLYSGGSASYVYFLAAAPTLDDSIVLVGSYSKSNADSDALVLKVTPLGNIIWKKILGGLGAEDALSVTVLGNGDIALVGETTGSLASDRDGFITLLSNTGLWRWSRTFGQDFDDDLQYITVSNDGGFYLVGNLYTPLVPSASEFNSTVLKINSVGLLDSTCSFIRNSSLPIKKPMLLKSNGSLWSYPLTLRTEPFASSRRFFRPTTRQFCN